MFGKSVCKILIIETLRIWVVKVLLPWVGFALDNFLIISYISLCADICSNLYYILNIPLTECRNVFIYFQIFFLSYLCAHSKKIK